MYTIILNNPTDYYICNQVIVIRHWIIKMRSYKVLLYRFLIDVILNINNLSYNKSLSINESFIILSQHFPNFSDLYTIFMSFAKPTDNQLLGWSKSSYGKNLNEGFGQPNT